MLGKVPLSDLTVCFFWLGSPARIETSDKQNPYFMNFWSICFTIFHKSFFCDLTGSISQLSDPSIFPMSGASVESLAYTLGALVVLGRFGFHLALGRLGAELGVRACQVWDSAWPRIWQLLRGCSTTIHWNFWYCHSIHKLERESQCTNSVQSQEGLS